MDKIRFSNATRSILDSLENRKMVSYENSQYIIEPNIFSLLKQRYGHVEEKYEDMEIPF